MKKALKRYLFTLVSICIVPCLYAAERMPLLASRAAAKINTDELVREAHTYLARGSYQDAFDSFLEAANAGNIEACYQLSLFYWTEKYDRGEIVSYSDEGSGDKAIELCELAAANGHVEAIAALGPLRVSVERSYKDRLRRQQERYEKDRKEENERRWENERQQRERELERELQPYIQCCACCCAQAANACVIS